MPATYTIDKENRWVHTMLWGTVSRADMLSMIDRALHEAELDASFAEIVDLTEVIKMELSGDDMREIAQSNFFSAHSRRAIVVPDNNHVVGLAQMYETLRATQGETALRIFRTLDEALNWVARRRETSA